MAEALRVPEGDQVRVGSAVLEAVAVQVEAREALNAGVGVRVAVSGAVAVAVREAVGGVLVSVYR